MFNGYGEYWLLKPENQMQGFSLQARTLPAWDAAGADIEATVFAAVAAKDNGTTTIHVELTRDREGGQAWQSDTAHCPNVVLMLDQR